MSITLRKAIMDRIRDFFASNDLYRSRDHFLLGGVFAGLGQRVGLQPWPARLVFTLVLLLLPGSQLLIYPVLWVLMPLDTRTEASAASRQPVSSASRSRGARSSRLR